MSNKVLVKDFKGTSIIFSKSLECEDTIDIAWQISINGIRYEYQVGSMLVKRKLEDKDIELYATEFMDTVTFYKIMSRLMSTLCSSQNVVEREGIRTFYKLFLKDLGGNLLRICSRDGM